MSRMNFNGIAAAKRRTPSAPNRVKRKTNDAKLRVFDPNRLSRNAYAVESSPL
jgi:hypothetical protein